MRIVASASAARRSGDKYQDVVAADALLALIEKPGTFEFFELEAKEHGSLDDVVGTRVDGGQQAWQVKYATSTAIDEFGWDLLLERHTDASRSLLEKLRDGYGKLPARGTNDARLITNRAIAPSFGAVLVDGHVDWKLVDEATKKRVEQHFASKGQCLSFFENFTFEYDGRNLAARRESLSRRLAKLELPAEALENLLLAVEKWVLSPETITDGRIRRQDVEKATGWRVSEPIPQPIDLPTDFVVPSKQFESELVTSLESATRTCLGLTGTAGAGKSTYLTHLAILLEQRGHWVVRHHYYMQGARGDRFDATRVAESLAAYCKKLKDSKLGPLETKSARPNDLGVFLDTLGPQAKTRGKRLFVILDGIDHIKRDRQNLDGLARLVEEILPLPDGVTFILGTQPLRPEEVPTKLVEHGLGWVTLPNVDFVGILEWTRKHAKHLALRDGPSHGYQLSEFATTINSATNGHALCLSYFGRQLAASSTPLTNFQVQSLPTISGNDIESYYEAARAHVGEPLAVAALELLAILDFPITAEGISQCLDPAHSEAAAVSKAINGVRHLLVEGPLGFEFFHSSLQAHTARRIDEARTTTRLGQLARWLERDAPPYSRWRNLWVILDRAGDSRPLLDGVNRTWATDGLLSGFPLQDLLFVLKRAAQAALEKADFVRYVRIGVLQDYVWQLDYLEENPNETLRAAIGLRPLQERAALACYHRAQIPSGSLVDVLAEVPDGLALTIRKPILQELEYRARFGRNRFFGVETGHVEFFLEALVANDQGRKLADLMQKNPMAITWATTIAHWCFTARNLQVLAEAASGMTAQQKSASMFYACLLAYNEGADLPESLRESCMGIGEVLFPKSSSTPLPTSQSVVESLKAASAVDDGSLQSILEQVWWQLVAANITKQDSTVTWAPLGEDPAHQALRLLTAGAAKLAADPSAWNVRDALNELEWSSSDYSPRAHYYHQAMFHIARRTIVAWLIRSPQLVTPTELEQVFGLWFGHEIILDAILDIPEATLDPKAAVHLLQKVDAQLSTTVQSYWEKAHLLGKLALAASKHSKTVEAKALAKRAASCLLAPGYHKDLILGELLAAFEEVRGLSQNSDVKRLLAIAPFCVAYDTYTDSDETRYLPEELAEALMTVAPELLDSWYATLREDDSYLKGKILAIRAPHLDLTDPSTRAVAKTFVEPDLRRQIIDRAEAGDERATEVEASLVTQLGSQPTDQPKDPSPEREVLPVQDYPPDKLQAFLQDSSKKFDYRALERWLSYWKQQQPAPLLLNHLERLDADVLHQAGPIYLELFTKVKGRTAAYQSLVDLYRTRHGWEDRMYASREEAEAVWATVIAHHDPPKFVRETLWPIGPRPIYLVRNRVPRLVAFLRRANRNEEAGRVVDAFLDEVILLFEGQQIPTPGWCAPETRS